MPEHIIGIDPGTKYTGVALVGVDDGAFEVILRGTVNLPDDTMVCKLATYRSALAFFVKDIAQRRIVPTTIGIEAAGGWARGTNALWEFIGVTRLFMLDSYPLNGGAIGIAPSTVKKLVAGDGKAKKSEVKNAVLSLTDVKGKVNTHEIDAIAVAIAIWRQSNE